MSTTTTRDGRVYLHLASVELANVPPSINRNTLSRDWRASRRHKRAWQADLERILMSAGLDRPILTVGPLLVQVTLHFRDRRRRDSENYRVLLSKALGDALVNGRWMVDDTDAHWRLDVTVGDVRPAPATSIAIHTCVGSL